jgi:integrase
VDVDIDINRLDKIALDFDDECQRAVGMSFYAWLKSKVVAYKATFNFNKKNWETLGKPSLHLLKDASHPLGDQTCMRFLELFGEDKKRIRRRKSTLRYFFRFLGRKDLLDRHLSMTTSRDPKAVKSVPEISMKGFPDKLEKAIDKVGDRLGKEYATALRFKIATQMRTGSKKKESELLGITTGEADGGSWLIFEGEDAFRGEVKAKRNQHWIIEWLPERIRHEVYKVYREREKGDHLFDLNIVDLRREFKEACVKFGLPPLTLHDLRKVAITWLWAMGIEMSIATEINVGWKDLNTVKVHYLRMGEMLKRQDRKEYRDAIPEWFKDGLRDYVLASIPYSIDEIVGLMKGIETND